MIAPGEVDVDPAVVAARDLDLGLDAHALHQSGDKGADGGELGVLIDGSGLLRRALLFLGFLFYRLLFLGLLLCGGLLLRLLRGGGGGLFLGGLVGDLIAHADHRGLRTDAQKAALFALEHLVADLLLAHAELGESGRERILYRAAGFFQIFDHVSFSCSLTGLSSAVSSTGSDTAKIFSSATLSSMETLPSDSSAAASVAASAFSGLVKRSGT